MQPACMQHLLEGRIYFVGGQLRERHLFETEGEAFIREWRLFEGGIYNPLLLIT